MKNLIVILTFFTMSLLSGVAIAGDDCAAGKAREAANKKAAMEFFQLLVGDIDYEGAKKYVAEYIQHDPEVPGDGIDALIHYLKTDPKFKNRPKKQVAFHNVMADGDLVCFQIRTERPAPDDGTP